MENQKKEVWLRKALFFIVSLALFFPMMAQTITVKGVVKESMTGEPIIGANVAVKGTTNGTISDISGYVSDLECIIKCRIDRFLYWI